MQGCLFDDSKQTIAGGPKGNWMENRLETTDSPTSSSEAKKAYLRVKKSKELASNGKQIADNDLAEKDYTGNRITTNHPRQGKTSSDPTVQHKTATGKDPDLTAGCKVDAKAEAEPTNNAVNNINVISGLRKQNE